MMQICDIMIKEKKRTLFAVTFCGKNVDDFSFNVSHNLQMLIKYYSIYTNFK